MPIYMDRHDVSAEVNAEHVAKIHQEDLKIEHQYNCRGLTYWFDDKRKTAFCLIEAPNKKAIKRMHDQAHGDLPHKIIEVDEKIVELFLGRIEDPKNTTNSDLNIVNDSPFRIIMVIETNSFIKRIEANQFGLFSQKFHNSVLKSIKKFRGNIVKNNNNSYLVSFRSVSNAVACALKILNNTKYTTPKFDSAYRNVHIGISSGEPVAENNAIFEDAIVLAKRMCEAVKDKLVITNDVNQLYLQENKHSIIDKDTFKVLTVKEEKFLTCLMNLTKTIWNKSDFRIENLSSKLGYSQAQTFRKIKKLTGKSPNKFIKDFRLHQALLLLYKQEGNISDIAYETGFNSPAYFSACFEAKFGLLPSKYIQQHVAI
ncbi:MAG: nickel-binding protein [Lutibacter sp.]